jgi:hypothetical protein
VPGRTEILVQHDGMTELERGRATSCFAAATLVLSAGVMAAVAHFPDGFDWVYMVISKLGSRTHNPVGALWLSGSLLAAVCLLWPVSGVLLRAGADFAGRPRRSIMALRIGLIGGAFLAMESLFALDLSRIGRKAHEIAALATFLGLYGGVLGLFMHRIRRMSASPWPALVVLLPLCAVAVSQVALYFDQRDLGWVNVAWREMGIPFWLSFAFWQWSAVAFLGLGLGYLVVARHAIPDLRADVPG